MAGVWLPVVVGLASGVLSGAFGVGGAVVTTPAIRLVLGEPELIAVGTPLAVVIPTAIAGAASYAYRGLADVRAGLAIGLAGAPFAVLGAYGAGLAGGRAVLLVTAGLIVYLSAVMAASALRSSGPVPEGNEDAWPAGTGHPRTAAHVALGAGTGLLAGFLGLGGGFVIVPVLVRWLGYSVKEAAGTSLVAIGLIAVPGAFTHWVLGHVDPRLAALLVVGVVPGALAGARLTAAASERAVRLGFAVMLAGVGLVLGLAEAGAV